MSKGATWIGIGVKSGGQLLFGGVESETGRFFNLNSPGYQMNYSITSSRWGFGLGGGAGLSLIIVFNSNALLWLDGQELSDWGINLALGERWKDVAWFMADKKINLILKLITKNPVHFFANISSLRDLTSIVYNAYDLQNSKDKHPMLSLEIPMTGFGLEVSAFKKSGKIFLDEVI